MPDQREIMRKFVLPLACIPASAWVPGLVLFNPGKPLDPVRLVHSAAVVYFGAVGSVLLLAASLFLLAPLFMRRRNWARSLQVAAFSSAPTLLSGIVLLIPDLAFATLPAIFYTFYHLYVGAQRALGVKEGDSTEYVALVIVLFIIGSTLAGAFGSSLGLL